MGLAPAEDHSIRRRGDGSDLHWAAEPTLHMLRHVLHSERNMNLLVIGTYRDTEIDRTHPLGALLAHLRRTGGVDRQRLSNDDRCFCRQQAAFGLVHCS